MSGAIVPKETPVELLSITDLLRPMQDSCERLYRHSFRVANLSLKIGCWLNLEEKFQKTLVKGALLHDVGKTCINQEILNKPGKLNEQEWVEIKKHTRLGAGMAAENGEDSSLVEIVRYHHERWDGRGYEGRVGEQIPLGARIIALADAFDAMISVRPYRGPLKPEEALEQIRQGAGSQFDPLLVASLKVKPFWQTATYCNPDRLAGLIAEEKDWLNHLVKLYGKQLPPLVYAQRQWLNRLTTIASSKGLALQKAEAIIKEGTAGGPSAIKDCKLDAVCSLEDKNSPCAYVKNGRLFVKHHPDGPYPVVIPCKGLKLMVNGQERTQPIPVTSQDMVQVETVNERIEGKWAVAVSPDGVQAVLQIRPTLVIHRELKELPAARKLQLAIIEREERFPPLTLNELLQELSRLGISYGIDWEACSRGAASCVEEEIVIARGVAAIPGKDGWVELLFSSECKQAVVTGEEEAVDFRKRYVFTSVTEGEILAVKHLPEPGVPGTGVRGEIVAPPAPDEISLVAGEGVVLTEDGERAIAARAGRPVSYRGHKMIRVSVLPELVHKGNVGLASGSIAFKGDVLIAGNAEEGITVEAGGNVRIGGLADGVKIQAGGSVLIKGNVLTSEIIAGGTPAYFQELRSQVQALSTGLRELIMAIHQLLGLAASRQGGLYHRIGSLLNLLFEGKFQHLRTTAEAFKKQVEALPPGLAGEGLDELIKEIERVVYFPQSVLDLKEVEKLANKVLEWEQYFLAAPTAKGDVVAANILNSTIKATGDVRVVGGGCYNSRIQADKQVNIAGVFRGGEIRAGEDVSIGELGSRGGTETRVVVSPRATVKVKLGFDNAIVIIGSQAYRFKGHEKNVRLGLDKEGNLQSRTMSS